MSSANDLTVLVAGAAIGAGLVVAAKKYFPYKPPAVWQNVSSGGKFANINRPTAGAQKQQDLQVGKHPIQLYSLGTPNGVKVTILLEEVIELDAKFDYDAWLVNIGAGDQFTSGFVSANPNSKIPAMIDNSTSPPTRVFESAAMMMYLNDKFAGGKFVPTDPAKKAECLSWLFWQMGSAPFLGGGFGHFYAYAPVKIEYAINRYAMETKRQLDVLDQQLAKNQYVAGDEYTLADMAIWPWYGNMVLGKLYSAAEFLQVQDYKNVLRWANQIGQRPAVKRGRMVNRTWGEESEKLPERHGREDFPKSSL